MDPVQFFDKATSWAESRMKDVSRDQLEDATPCTEWNVRDLVNHVTGGVTAVARGASGEKADPETYGTDYCNGDAGKAFSKARKAAMKAIHGDNEVMTKTFNMPWGDMPAPMALMILGSDSLIHGHDVAKATGQDTEMPADVAEAAFEMMQQNAPNFERGEMFADEVKVADDAPTQDKLIAFSGRKP